MRAADAGRWAALIITQTKGTDCGIILFVVTHHSAERNVRMFSTQPPTPARLEQWKRIRTTGKHRYVLSYGVLTIGTCLFGMLGGFLFLIETGLFSLVMGGTSLPVPLPVPDDFWLLLLAITALCYTLGYVVGKSRWTKNDDWYQYYTRQQPTVNRDAK